MAAKRTLTADILKVVAPDNVWISSKKTKPNSTDPMEEAASCLCSHELEWDAGRFLGFLGLADICSSETLEKVKNLHEAVRQCNIVSSENSVKFLCSSLVALQRFLHGFESFQNKPSEIRAAKIRSRVNGGEKTLAGLKDEYSKLADDVRQNINILRALKLVSIDIHKHEEDNNGIHLAAVHEMKRQIVVQRAGVHKRKTEVENEIQALKSCDVAFLNLIKDEFKEISEDVHLVAAFFDATENPKPHVEKSLTQRQGQKLKLTRAKFAGENAANYLRVLEQEFALFNKLKKEVDHRVRELCEKSKNYRNSLEGNIVTVLSAEIPLLVDVLYDIVMVLKKKRDYVIRELDIRKRELSELNGAFDDPNEVPSLRGEKEGKIKELESVLGNADSNLQHIAKNHTKLWEASIFNGSEAESPSSADFGPEKCVLPKEVIEKLTVTLDDIVPKLRSNDPLTKSLLELAKFCSKAAKIPLRNNFVAPPEDYHSIVPFMKREDDTMNFSPSNGENFVPNLAYQPPALGSEPQVKAQEGKNGSSCILM